MGGAEHCGVLLSGRQRCAHTRRLAVKDAVALLCRTTVAPVVSEL